MCWTVGISPLGVGPTGRGNSFPLPCLPHSNHLTLLPASPIPPAPAAKDTHTLLPAPPPHPRLRRSSPAPVGGVGSAWRYQGSSRIRGGASGLPCPVSLRDLPMCWIVGISPLGVRPTGRGNLFPLPCLSHSNHLTSRRHPLPAPAAKDTRTLLPASPPPSRRKRAVPGRIPDRYRRQGSGPTGPPAGSPFSPGARILP